MSKWDSVDWSLWDAEIARRLGVSRERVRQVRKARGERPSPTPVSAVQRARELDLGRFTRAELAAELGVTTDYAAEIARTLDKRLRVDDDE